MEDIFKVVFYAVVVIIWIIYKANEQRKSGMWKKRTGQNQEPPEPQPQKEIEIPELLKKLLEEKKPVKKAVVPVKTPVKEGTSQVRPVSYYEPALKRPEGGPAIKTKVESTDFPPPETDGEQKVFEFDLRQSIIAAEILKRPPW